MAANKQVRIGPTYLANAAANILNGAVTSLAGPVGLTLTQPVLYIKHINILNKDVSSRTFTLYVGGTGGSTGGTEICGGTTAIAAGSEFNKYYGGSGLRLDSTDFLTGLASAASALVIQIEAEVGFQ
jgi:hypothetical protein